jgi:transcriptional regulator
MYEPPHFKVENQEEINAFIAAHSFGTLITQGEQGLFATHLPFFYQDNCFHGHIAKANPHPLGESLLIFLGVEGYISPNHYATKALTHKVVPTWNYEALHVRGTLEFTHLRDDKLHLVTRLTTQEEAQEPHPWAVSDAPQDYIEGQLKGIIGLKFTPSQFQFKRKMSQNRSDADREGVKAGLAKTNPILAEKIRVL